MLAKILYEPSKRFVNKFLYPIFKSNIINLICLLYAVDVSA
jgi:hypothetical protein